MSSTAARKPEWISPEGYLEREECSGLKHEYVGGHIFAMAGGSNRHAAIATNILVELGLQLRGKPCRPFNSDTKVHIRHPDYERFYYPDAMVVCRQNPPSDHFQDEPAVIFEVLSPSTERTDFDSKRAGYCSLASLYAYVIVGSDERVITIYRRAGSGWLLETLSERDEVIALPEIECALPLLEIYRDVDLI